MRLIDMKGLNGPNYWSVKHQQLIVAKLDLQEFEYLPTNKIDGFYDRITETLPSLIEHHCSENHRGGFFERVKEGTWLGHVIEHIALELQWLAGMKVGFGRTRSAETRGVYFVVFAYIIEEAGLYSLNAAFDIVKGLINGAETNVQAHLRHLADIRTEQGFGPTTSAIIDEASDRGIPVRQLKDCDLLILGQGKFQKMFRGSIVGSTSYLGIDLTDSKILTKSILAEAGIPLSQGKLVKEPGDLFLAVNELGFPLVVKPVNGNHGRGVVTNIRTYTDLEKAFEIAKRICCEVLIERYIEGDDYRLLVVNFKLVAAAKRTPGCVVGDGRSSIQQLIDQVNQDPRRGDGHENVLTKIDVNDTTYSILEDKGLRLTSILAAGEVLFLKKTANLSTGGTSTDVTDMVHPFNIHMAERIARVLNLDVCGIDIISSDIGAPLTTESGAVIEVNASPGLRMHLAPSSGRPRNVAKDIVELLYPPGSQASIPVVAITGTNGKTTTTRLIAHLARSQGLDVGCTTTDGIYIKGNLIEKGDCTGPTSARTVLSDPTVDFAVLECARGGILRAGLGFRHCDISVITNISEDHLGIDGISTLNDMARVKSVVAKSTYKHGYAILNADDDMVFAISRDLECKVALFSLKHNNKRVSDHCRKGGLAAFIDGGMIVVLHGRTRVWISRVKDIPLSFEGKADCMIQNMLPAVLVGIIRNFELSVIRKSLMSFIPSFEFTPGRMNIYNFPRFDVMIDYGHNAGGLMQIRNFLEHLNPTVKVGIITAVGDRRDEDIENIGYLSATMFDQIIIRLDRDLRGRTAESMLGLLQQGINRRNRFIKPLVIPDEIEALQLAISSAADGSFITVFTDQVQKTSEFIRHLQKEARQTAIAPAEAIVSHG
jgi:cyanophycin synthetase